MSIRDAATQTSAQIQDELTAAAEALLGQIGEAATEVEQTGADLDAQWEALSAKAEEWMTRAQEVEDQLQTLGDELVSRATELRQHVDDAMDQGNSLADATRTVIETLDQGVAALSPDIDAVAAEVESTFGAFGEQAQALDAALEETRSITDKHIHDPFNSLVDDLKTQIFERGSDLGNYVDTDFTTTLTTQVSELTAHVDDVVQQAGDKMEEVRSTAESEGSNVLDQVKSMFGDQFGDLIQTVEQVQSIMEQVGDVISGTADAVGTTTQVMTAGTSMTAIGAKSVIGIIEDIIDIFNSVT